MMSMLSSLPMGIRCVLTRQNLQAPPLDKGIRILYLRIRLHFGTLKKTHQLWYWIDDVDWQVMKFTLWSSGLALGFIPHLLSTHTLAILPTPPSFQYSACQQMRVLGRQD